jgi:hypothetical protein
MRCKGDQRMLHALKIAHKTNDKVTCEDPSIREIRSDGTTCSGRIYAGHPQ